MVKSKAKAFSYSANDVWAVACKAQRLNKEYIKFVPNSYLVGSGFYKIIENKLKESVKNPELKLENLTRFA